MARLILVDDQGQETLIKEGEISRFDIMLRSDYIATKAWGREDVESVLYEESIPVTTENVDAVVGSGLLKYLEECTDAEWETIRNAVQACREDKTLNEAPKTVKSLVKDCEHIRKYYFPEDPYAEYSVILPGRTASFDDQADIAAAMEDTLHRLMDAGADSNEIKAETGMIDEDDENDGLMDSYPEATSVDLGYFLPYAIAMTPAA